MGTHGKPQEITLRAGITKVVVAVEVIVAVVVVTALVEG